MLDLLVKFQKLTYLKREADVVGKSFQNSDFHPTAKVEILLSFDYFSGNAQHTLNAFPNIGAQSFCLSEQFYSEICNEIWTKRFGCSIY